MGKINKPNQFKVSKLPNNLTPIKKKKKAVIENKNKKKKYSEVIESSQKSKENKKNKTQTNNKVRVSKKKQSTENREYSNERKLNNSFSKIYPGDISEEDIDSDDDLSLDEDELPKPPDATSSEDESSEEEPEETQPVDNEISTTQDDEISTTQDDEISTTQDDEGRTIFVGNLPKSLKRKQLKKRFSKYGTVESVRLRCAPLADPSIPKKVAVIKQVFHEERSNIHGFVKFSTAEEAHKALAENGQLFHDTHHLRVDIARKDNQKPSYDDKKAAFVGNLPFAAEEDHLWDHFADCGDIIAVRIVRDKKTAVGKGFAFINFAARHSVRLAMEKNGSDLLGRKLRVEKVSYNKQFPTQKNQNTFSNNQVNKGKHSRLNFKKNDKISKPEFQGLSAAKGDKVKKLSKKKRKLRKEKEILKKVLNSNSKINK